MSISFFSEDVPLPKINYPLLKRIIKNELAIKGFKLGDLNYIFCSDEHLHTINIEFLQHDFYTDVITFDYSEGYFVAGDVFISIDRVLDNSEILLETYQSELVRVIFHGLLHLLQFNDKTEEEILIMRGKEMTLINCYFEIVK
jgi:probable rRNA maturation factor